MKRVLALAVFPAVYAVFAWHLFAGWQGWALPVHDVIGAGLGVTVALSLAAAWRGARVAHVALVVFLLGFQLVTSVCWIVGVELVPYAGVPDPRPHAVIAAMVVFAIYGLVRGRVWGRWIGIALGAAGTLCGLLNLWSFWSVTREPNLEYLDWSREMYQRTWVFCLTTIGGALIIANLAMPAVRSAFAGRGTTWASSHGVVRLLRWTIMASFAAVPMLLIYGWFQPTAPQTQTTALVLAAALAAGGVLAVRGKVVGALLLVASGLGLVAQTVVTLANAEEMGIAYYYAAFWLPAGALALACGARMARPTVRLLRG